MLWYTALGILCFVLGAAALRLVEARIDGAGAARRAYAFSCLAGVAGLIVLAWAPDALIGGIGVLLADGIAFTVTREVSVVWVNQRTSSDVRATVHSFLSQAECAGELSSGFPARFARRGRGDLGGAHRFWRAHRLRRRGRRPVPPRRPRRPAPQRMKPRPRRPGARWPGRRP